jgi:Na+/H+ antiporter NhaD/arsenite permease-like protein
VSLTLVAFTILVVAFLWGSVTAVNAGIIAIVASFVVGTFMFDVPVKEITGMFPASLFFILAGATLLFSIVKATGTIDLLAMWAERATGGRRALVPVMMFLLTAVLATAGAFTPAAVAIVAPVALALGTRYGISRLAMGLVIVQGANAGAFSPVNPFGVVANQILDTAGAEGGELRLFLNCFVFNTVLGVLAYLVVQTWMTRREAKAGVAPVSPAPAGPGGTSGTSGTTATATATATATGTETVTAAPKVDVTPMRLLTLAGLAGLLVLTLGFGVDVGVAALAISLVLLLIRPSLQKPAIDLMPWSAIVLVTGIVMYVGLLEHIGAIAELEESIAGLSSGSTATLVTSYVVGLVSAFASTTGTLGAITPVVVPLAADPTLSAIGVVSAIAVSSSVVDVSPMSTTGALLMANADAKDERAFFRALLLWAILMIAVVPALAWLVFVVI